MRLPALLLALAVLLPGLAAAAYPDPDRVPRHYDSDCTATYDRRFVHDYVGVMQAHHAVSVEGAACEVYAATGAHFVLVGVESTDGETLENYALRLFETWGVGLAERNDGLMLLYVRNHSVAGAASAIRVEVGYGLEHVVNTGVAMDAIRLARDAKERALDAGYTDREASSHALALASAVLLNELDAAYVDGAFPEPDASGPPVVFWIIVLVIFVIIVILLAFDSKPRRGRPGWGYHAGNAAWGQGMGRVFVGGGGLGGGGFGGGGFGGGRSGGGGGSGGF